jgi:hypothetical protein
MEVIGKIFACLAILIIPIIIWDGIQRDRQEKADARAMHQPRTAAQMGITDHSTVKLVKHRREAPFVGANPEQTWEVIVNVHLINRSGKDRRVWLCGPKLVTVDTEFGTKNTQHVCNQWAVKRHSTFNWGPNDNGLGWQFNRIAPGLRIKVLDLHTHIQSIDAHPIVAPKTKK